MKPANSLGFSPLDAYQDFDLYHRLLAGAGHLLRRSKFIGTIAPRRAYEMKATNRRQSITMGTAAGLTLFSVISHNRERQRSLDCWEVSGGSVS